MYPGQMTAHPKWPPVTHQNTHRGTVGIRKFSPNRTKNIRATAMSLQFPQTKTTSRKKCTQKKMTAPPKLLDISMLTRVRPLWRSCPLYRKCVLWLRTGLPVYGTTCSRAPGASTTVTHRGSRYWEVLQYTLAAGSRDLGVPGVTYDRW